MLCFFYNFPCGLGQENICLKVGGLYSTESGEDLPIVRTAAITPMAACKSLFSGGVSCLPGVMCAMAWCGVTLVTADEGSTGCVWHSKMTGMPSARFGFQSGEALLLMQILPIFLLVIYLQCQYTVKIDNFTCD